ncbi:hypothetical protein GO730_02060 [Spirosoma sp. HMF3257]|uniref:Uncharacterized protein n=1 Tax=Spirosoma telluris TaxID=2183553 RepID=A0A327NF35_9BACT|nr:hypothetical protein [Spirosoma telluris]RAI73505.1 hypothetical protein HMF3257_02020 [Spirosoma telluris]
MGNSVDLTSLYRNQVDRVQREVTLNANRSVTIDDQWTTGNNPVEAPWQWLTRAEITRTPNGLLLRQDGKSLALLINSSTPNTITIDDVSGAKNPQDSPNPGVSRIVVRLASPANSTTKLTVQIIPGSVAGK